MTNVDFALNGRFLVQPVTGVQRYARSVAAAMSVELDASGHMARILGPRGTDNPGLAAMPLREIGPGNGHAWEQLTLPARWHGRLLSLGNTAPASKRNQVVCVHDANVFEAPSSYGRSFRALYSTLLPAICQSAARLTTVSADSARQLARHLPVEVRDIAILPNGHEHALLWDPLSAVAAPRALASLPGGPDCNFVLVIGSRARHKNLDLMKRIAPQLAGIGIEVVVAGGSGAIFSEAELVEAPNVLELGQVTDGDLAYLLDKALCLAFPSWTEGFGLPIVEAMARNCPVVSSNRASMPEVCGDAALMASPDDPEAWTNAIARLAAAPKLRQDLIGRGRERVKLFSWAETANGYLSLMAEPSARVGRRGSLIERLPTVAVAIATLGRPEVVSRTVREILSRQTLRPEQVVVVRAAEGDEGNVGKLSGVTVLQSASGLTRQRNVAMAVIRELADVIVFFDDDFVPEPSWLETVARSFRDEPDLVSLTGHVVADGVKGPGITFDEALRLLELDVPSVATTWEEPFSPYGCNMAFRSAAIGDSLFDERLPLYCWLEDRDFGAMLVKKGGRSARTGAARGVHMGVKAGRGPGNRLGYSQVINPLYMLSKGTMSRREVAGQLFRNIASNAIGALRPEPFIDRRGRLLGNASAFVDVLRGKREPERALRLTATRKKL